VHYECIYYKKTIRGNNENPYIGEKNKLKFVEEKDENNILKRRVFNGSKI